MSSSSTSSHPTKSIYVLKKKICVIKNSIFFFLMGQYRENVNIFAAETKGHNIKYDRSERNKITPNRI